MVRPVAVNRQAASREAAGREAAPVLRLDGARPAPEAAISDLRHEARLPAITLQLHPGEMVLVAAPDRALGRALAALCAGLPRLAEGRACFLGRDWAGLRRREAEALRGRIAQVVPDAGGWLPHLDIADSILLPRLHHDARPEPELRAEAEALARRFGLEGLPPRRPPELADLDLARAAYVRAFLGGPALLLLDRPLRRGLWNEELGHALLDTLAAARGRGTAVVWVSAEPSALWDDPRLTAGRRLRLDEAALAPLEAAPAAPVGADMTTEQLRDG